MVATDAAARASMNRTGMAAVRTPLPSPTETRILSVVCVLASPVEALLPALIELHAELAKLAVPTEIVAVLNTDDDNSISLLRNIIGRCERLQVYVMKRRVDHATAQMAGIENAIGDWVATLDLETDDLTIIQRLLDATLTQRADIGLGMPQGSKRPFLDAVVSSLFHRIFRSLHGFNLAEEAPTARLLSRTVLNHVLRHDSPLVALETLPAKGGYRKCTVPTQLRRTAHRKLAERVRMRWRTLIGINAVPLRLANLVCGIAAIGAWMYSGYVIVIYLAKRDVVPGWTTVSLMLSSMFMMLALVLWLLSEYMILLLDPAARRPRYEIADEFGGRLRPRDDKLNVDVEL